MASLAGDSTMEDGHYRAKYEALRLQMKNKQKILADYEAELARKDQVLCPPVRPTKRKLRQAIVEFLSLLLSSYKLS